MNQHNIERTEFAHRYPPKVISDDFFTGAVSGELVYMDNGDVWFHPYSGSKAQPWQTFNMENCLHQALVDALL